MYRDWGMLGPWKSPGSLKLLIESLLGASRSAGARTGDVGGEDVVHEAVVLRLLRGEPAVAVAVLDDLLDRLPGLVRGDPGQLLLPLVEQVRLDRDVRRRAADTGRGLVHQDAGVRERVALARRARGEQELPHRG